jgi:hypothetical protein
VARGCLKESLLTVIWMVDWVDNGRSLDSRLSNCSKLSTYRRKEVLEEYVHFRDHLKMLVGVLIDEVWKHCHLSAQDFKISDLSLPKSEKVIPKINKQMPKLNTKFSLYDKMKPKLPISQRLK